MILATIAAAGFAAGVAGLWIGLTAKQKVARTVEECAEVLRRQLQVATGVVDNQTLRDIAIVHYDALKEMSGERSFSLALLNSVGDGVVLSSINGRTETRTYAKVVLNGHGVEALSPEEDQAVRAARLGKGPIVRMDDPLPDFGHRSPVASYSPLHRPAGSGTGTGTGTNSGSGSDAGSASAAAPASAAPVDADLDVDADIPAVRVRHSDLDVDVDIADADPDDDATGSTAGAEPGAGHASARR